MQAGPKRVNVPSFLLPLLPFLCSHLYDFLKTDQRLTLEADVSELEIGLHTRQRGIRIVEFTQMRVFAAPQSPSERLLTPRLAS
jgi:hypothetical protein